MNSQLKILSFSIRLKTYFKKEDNVTFSENRMILGRDPKAVLFRLSKFLLEAMNTRIILIYVFRWVIVV
jgi:hypothetical protein